MTDTVEAWMYIGRRVSDKNKLCQCWLKADGSEHLYSKPVTQGPPIGGCYEITRVADGGYYIKGAKRPRYVKMTEVDTTKWSAEDRAAQQMDVDRRVVAKMKLQGDVIDTHIEALKNISHKLTNYERAAFIQHVVAEFWRR